LRAFVKDFNWLEKQLQEEKHTQKKVIITHHLPSSRLIHKRFKYDLSTTAFHTHIVDKLELHGVKYWFCGHTHEQMKSKYGNTTLFVNPLGYPQEKRETELSTEVFEI
jgi:Icc-related predicted phosphoesterase